MLAQSACGIHNEVQMDVDGDGIEAAFAAIGSDVGASISAAFGSLNAAGNPSIGFEAGFALLSVEASVSPAINISDGFAQLLEKPDSKRKRAEVARPTEDMTMLTIMTMIKSKYHNDKQRNYQCGVATMHGIPPIP